MVSGPCGRVETSLRVSLSTLNSGSKMAATIATKTGSSRYVLVTAAYNEEAHLAKTLSSVISQTCPPEKWVIVSDGSTDRTDAITLEYAKEYPFVELLRREKDPSHDFASKVYALAAGYQLLRSLSFEFIGHLDADVSFGPTYFADLLLRFERDPQLGIAGGSIFEWDGKRFRPRSGNRTRSVAGAVQMFRRDCYEAIGGFLPLPYGGEDWCAETMARMRGWEVRCFPELQINHERPTGDAAGRLRYSYRQGLMDYSLGVHPLFDFIKISRRMKYGYFLGGLARLSGFILASCRGEKRMVSKEFVEFLRKDQMARIKMFLRIGRGGGRDPLSGPSILG
jgi:biofilm PGA synthesis N-glycosyltransferase PgaC